MALGALEDHIIRGIGMAGSTHAVGVAMIHVEPGVIEHCAQPRGRRVAGRAGRWEQCGNMIWNTCQRRRALPLSGVATVAIDRRHRRAGVAKVAGHRDMRAGQWETGKAMVKNRAQPGSSCVARRACGWVPGSDVIRHRPAQCCRALPLSGMATVAIRWQGAGIITVCVARRAGYGDMRTRQWKSRRAVVESGGCPVCS